MSDVYGEIFIPSDLEAGFENLLKEWFPEYLTEMETRLVLPVGTLKVPANYTTRNKFETLKGEETPKVVIMSSGLNSVPKKHNRSDIEARFRVGVGIAVAGQTEDDARKWSHVYGAVVRSIVMHHPSINGIASDTDLLDEQYVDLPISSQLQQFQAANVWFECGIPIIVQKWAGPKNPATVTGVANTVTITKDLI